MFRSMVSSLVLSPVGSVVADIGGPAITVAVELADDDATTFLMDDDGTTYLTDD